MKVCGIELKSNEARIIAIEGSLNDFEVMQLKKDRIKLEDPKNQEAVKDFHVAFAELFAIHQFDAIAIKERIMKGRFKGGSVSFKMEGLIQMCDDPIQLIHGATMKSKMKNLDMAFDEVKKFQVEALKVAVYLMMEVR